MVRTKLTYADFNIYFFFIFYPENFVASLFCRSLKSRIIWQRLILPLNNVIILSSIINLNYTKTLKLFFKLKNDLMFRSFFIETLNKLISEGLWFNLATCLRVEMPEINLQICNWKNLVIKFVKLFKFQPTKKCFSSKVLKDVLLKNNSLKKDKISYD